MTPRIEPHRPSICTISGREAAVPCKIVPLKQYKISAKTIGKLELMTKEVCVVGSFLGGVLGPRNVRPARIVWVGGRIVEIVGHERQRIRIEAGLRGHFTGYDWARLDLEMSHMMGREDALDIDNRSFFVAFLDDLN